jgi:hypothetical protein
MRTFLKLYAVSPCLAVATIMASLPASGADSVPAPAAALTAPPLTRKVTVPLVNQIHQEPSPAGAALPAAANEIGVGDTQSAAGSPIGTASSGCVSPPESVPAVVPVTYAQMTEAYAAAANEIRSANGLDAGIPVLLESLPFHFSDPTTAKLCAIFGNAQPLLVTRSLATRAWKNYAIELPALVFVGSDGVHYKFPPAQAQVTADTAGRRLNVTAAWPLLKINEGNTQMRLRDIRFEARHHSAGVPWMGNFQAQARTIASGPAPQAYETEEGIPPPPPKAILNNVVLKADTNQHGTAMEVRYDFSSGRYSLLFLRFEKMHLRIRVTKLALEDLQMLDGVWGLPGSMAQASAQSPAGKPGGFKEFCQRAVLGGTAIMIDDMSTSFHGSTASLKGSIGMKNVIAADFDSAESLFMKMSAHLEFRVSARLVRNVSEALRSILTNEAKPAHAPVASLREDLANEPVKSMLAEGLVRLEKGELRSTVKLENGTLTVNGKKSSEPASLMAIVKALASTK